MATNPVMTTRELAEYIRLHEKTVIRMAQDGKIPGVKIGNQWRFHLAAIDRYLQADLMESGNSDLDLIIRTNKDIIPLSRLSGIKFMKLNSPAKTPDEVLKGLCKITHDAGLTTNESELYKELKQREDMLSTAVCNGVALPHPRHPSAELFKAPKVVVLRTKTGINFDAPDRKLVHLFFMPCAPNEFVHIRILAIISKLLHISGMVDRLMEATNKDQVMRLLMEFDREHLFLG